MDAIEMNECSALVNELRNMYRAYVATDNGNCKWAKTIAEAADRIEFLEREFLDLAHKYLRLAADTEWIPVEKQMPPEHVPVLACCADDDFFYISRMHKSFEDYEVTHWKPIIGPLIGHPDPVGEMGEPGVDETMGRTVL